MGSIKLDKIVSNFAHCGACDEPKYFTQFNIYDNFPLYCNLMKDDNIETTIATLEINSVKIVDTVQGISIEGQQLTGKKLIIIGKINTKIIFSCPKNERKLCLSKKSIPFSTFIIIPNELCEEQPINLRYLIEDITTIIIAKNKIFVSITLLMQYVDEY